MAGLPDNWFFIGDLVPVAPLHHLRLLSSRWDDGFCLVHLMLDVNSSYLTSLLLLQCALKIWKRAILGSYIIFLKVFVNNFEIFLKWNNDFKNFWYFPLRWIRHALHYFFQYGCALCAVGPFGIFFFFVCFDSMDNQSQYQYTITKKACQKNSSCFWLVERETVFSAERSLMQTAMRESFLVRHS